MVAMDFVLLIGAGSLSSREIKYDGAPMVCVDCSLLVQFCEMYFVLHKVKFMRVESACLDAGTDPSPSNESLV